MDHFYQVHTDGEYRDFEPVKGLAINGISRVTFNDAEHTAYTTQVNPDAFTDDDAFIHSNDCTVISWDEALKLVGEVAA